MTLDKVQSGQPLRISAETFNAFIDAAVANKSAQRSRTGDSGATVPTAGIVPVRNDTGADQERFAVLGLGEPLILPSENERAFQERLAFQVVSPDADQHAHRLCILQEPLAAGAVGRGMVTGVTPVGLTVEAENDELAAVVTGDTGGLTTSASGGARILWKEPGTGQVWGIIQFPAGGGDTLPAGDDLDTLRMIDGKPTFQAVLAWGQIAVRSPSHSLNGKGEETWVTPTTEDGALFDPEAADADGYGSTMGFYAAQKDGIDIGIEKNVGADVPGMHNTDDLEIHIRLAKQEGPGVLGVTAGGDAQVPGMIKAEADDRVLLRLSGTLQWGLIPTAAIADGAVTDAKITSVDWSKITNVPPDPGGDTTWASITGKPTVFPPEPHEHDLAGDVEGTTDNTQIATGAVTADKIAAEAVGTAELADGGVTTGKIAVGAVTNDRLANDLITIIAGTGLAGGGVVALGGTVSLSATGGGGPGGGVTSIGMLTGQGISHEDGLCDARTGEVTLGFYPYDADAGPVKGNMLYCGGDDAEAVNGQYPNHVLSFPVAGQRNALLVADAATGIPAWFRQIEVGTSTDGGATIKLWYATGKSWGLDATGTSRWSESVTKYIEVNPSASSLTVAKDASTQCRLDANTGVMTNRRSGTTFNVCDVATITNVTTAPTGTGVKGQMHFIY